MFPCSSGIDYLQFMQKERQNQESEISMLQKQIEGLNRTIRWVDTGCHGCLS